VSLIEVSNDALWSSKYGIESEHQFDECSASPLLLFSQGTNQSSHFIFSVAMTQYNCFMAPNKNKVHVSTRFSPVAPDEEF